MAERCKESVGRGREGLGQCVNTAVRDGLCGLHQPEAVARRHARADARWKHKSESMDRKYALAAAERAIVDAAVREREAELSGGASDLYDARKARRAAVDRYVEMRDGEGRRAAQSPPAGTEGAE